MAYKFSPANPYIFTTTSLNGKTLTVPYLNMNSAEGSGKSVTKSASSPSVNIAFFDDEKYFNGTSSAPSMPSGFSYSGTVKNSESFPTVHTVNMNKSTVSHGILRVNPKLTGNIKVVVDSQDNIYLDTFKTSDTLSQNKYRKHAVCPDIYYGKSIAAIFGDIPATELFKVEDRNYKLFSPVQTYKDQFYDVYNYGVRTNGDKLYKENFAYLAPLRIKQELPDFFLIFRVTPGEMSALDQNGETDSMIFRKYIESGSIVKVVDLREGSPVGTYIRNIQKESEKKQGYAFVSYDLDGYNIFNGISLSKGNVTAIYESPYLDKSVNQVGKNEHFTKGFERNGIVAKDLVNFEFMFDDESFSTNDGIFSFNNYVGIYIKMVKASDKDFHVKSYNAAGNTITSTDGKTFTLLNDTADLIYGVSDNETFTRVSSDAGPADIMKKYYKNLAPVPYKAIDTISVKSLNRDRISQFTTIQLSKRLNPGDIIKIVDSSNKHIWEILVSNAETYRSGSMKFFDNYGISRTVTVNETAEPNAYTIKRVSIIYRETADESYDIAVQCQLIYRAIRRFGENDYVNTGDYSENSVSIITNTSANFSCACLFTGEISPVGFFGKNFNTLNIKPLNTESLSASTLEKYPEYNAVGYEILGSYNLVKTDFISTSNYYLYGKVNKDLLDNNYTVFSTGQTTLNIPVQYYTGVSTKSYFPGQTKYVPSPADLSEYIIGAPYSSYISDQIIVYKLHDINVGYCSILNVKDYCFDVLNGYTANKGEYYGETSDGKSTRIFGKYFEESLADYLDINHTFDLPERTLISSNEQLTGLYNQMYNKSVGKSSVSLISPYCCKWNSVGTDLRQKPTRLLHITRLVDDSIKNVSYNKNYTNLFKKSVKGGSYASDYFVANKDSVSDQIGVELQFGSLLPNGLNTYIKENGKVQSFKDFILNNTELSFEDIIQGFNEVTSTVYSAGNNIIEFISMGVKFRMYSTNTDVFDFNKYAGYTAFILQCPSVVMDRNIDCIIDETSKEIMVLIYTGFTESNNDNGEWNAVQLACDISLDDITVKSEPEQTTTGSWTVKYYCYVPKRDNYTISDPTGKVLLLTSVNKKDFHSTNTNHITIFGNIVEVTDSYYKLSNPQMYNNDSAVTGTNLYPTNRNSIRMYNKKISMFLLSQDKLSDEFLKENNPYQALSSNINKCGLYVKTYTNSLDYSTLNDIIKVDIVDPIDHYATIPDKLKVKNGAARTNYTSGEIHPTYFEPAMYDIFTFSKPDNAASDTILKNINAENVNVHINTVERIPQMWYSKKSETYNYCTQIPGETLSSIDFIPDFSTVKTSWQANLYSNYVIENRQDIGSKVNGYMSGTDLTTFFGARGLVLKNGKGCIELVDWNDTIINYESNVIKLNITSTVIKLISVSAGFNSAWIGTEAASYNDKINFIKNTILNFISINNYNKFELYRRPQILDTLSFADFSEDEELLPVKNFKNELTIENGQYYMYIYPEIAGAYTAKMTIKL